MTPAWDNLTGKLEDDESSRLLVSLRSCDRAVLAAHFPVWAHPGQTIDPADPKVQSWRTWVIMAGRGFGKTLAGAEWVTAEIAAAADAGAEPPAIALIGATIEDARRVMVEGRSGLLTVAAGRIAAWQPSLHQLVFKGGATATLFSGASPDRLRGPEHHLAWCDELAKWERGADSWDMLQLGLRLGERPRALITTTPRPGPLLTAIIADADTILTGGATHANPHTPAAFKARVHALYAGTRLGAQEVDGRLLTDTPGALWTVELLTSCRAQESDWAPIARQRAEPASVGQPAPCNGDRTDVTDSLRDGLTPSPQRGEGWGEGAQPSRLATGVEPPHPTLSPKGRGLHRAASPFTRICIGVDPPVADGTCGIIACALDEDGIAHVLADHSVTARSPEGWARVVAEAAAIHALPQPSPLMGSTPLSASSGERGCGVDGDSCARAHERGEGAYKRLREAALAPRTTTQCLAAEQAHAIANADHSIPVTIIAETNQGGRMVQTILLTADPDLHVKPVTARMSKADRAAPIAHLFEAGKVRLHGRFPELEAELCGLIAGGGYEGPGQSPDRADAMVWALTELCSPNTRAPQVRAL